MIPLSDASAVEDLSTNKAWLVPSFFLILLLYDTFKEAMKKFY